MRLISKSLISFATTAVLMFLAVCAQAQNTWSVPGDYPTIQAAISSPTVMAGDTILVAASTTPYRESLSWVGKDLTIQGAGEGASIIDPSIAGGGPGGRCLYTSGLTSASRIEGFTFQNGTAVDGGGIYDDVSSSPTIADCTFSGNTATSSGGGIYNHYGASPTVTHCTFRGNGAVRGGGIGCNTGSSPTVTHCTFSNNTAYAGGGMYTYFYCTSAITNCTFANNSVTTGGGLFGYANTAAITNCLFRNNTASGSGGAIAYANNPSLGVTSSPLVTNCTLSANMANTGGAVSILYTTLNATNCIIWGNQAASYPAIFYDAGGSSNISYSDVDGLPNATPDGDGNFGADPLFVNALNGDLRLRNGSPCISMGTNAVVTSPPFLTVSGVIIDLIGNPRIFGSTVDLGALENQNAPATAHDDAYSTDEDTSLTVPAPGVLANDTDGQADTLTAIKVTNPAHGTLTLDADGSFTYTPNANYNGSDSFTYTTNDGALDSNVATVNITVNPINDAPTADDQPMATNEDTPVSGQLTGSDPDGDYLNFAKVSDPAHGTVTVNPDGSFTYTPNANYNGPDSFTFKVNDGTVDSNTATVNITVNPVNDVPVANNDAYTTNQNTPLTVTAPGLLANDTDGDGDALSAVLVSGPAHGTLTLNANGSFSYTPAPGYAGSDAFTYRASDGTASSNTATVNLTVNAAGMLVVEQITLKKTGSSTQVSLKIRNTGSVTATNVKILDATLSGAVSKPAVPISEKNIAGGASLSEMLSFKVGSGTRQLIISGTDSLGSFSYSQNVQVP